MYTNNIVIVSNFTKFHTWKLLYRPRKKGSLCTLSKFDNLVTKVCKII